MQTVAEAAACEVEHLIRARGEVPAVVVLAAVRHLLGLPEEQCALEIFAGMTRLVRRGVVDCNTASPDRREITYGAHTVLTARFTETVH